MKKIEHIGIAVKNLEVSNALYEKLLGVAPYKEEEVLSEGVNTSFFKAGPNKIELLESTTADLVAELKRLKQEGFIILNETPKKGADNKLVAFVHPKSTHGVLVELCQEVAKTP
jgi:methylmalonyl-CoA/ethylmalonyl-CoA epimerase